jgi:glycerol-3-phosphate cytidylyltransferase
LSSPNLKKIGITFSCFDLFHAGHVQMLREAKTVCDYLIIGLQVDPSIDRPEKNSPLQSITERYIQVDACKYVDEIIPYSTESDLLDLLELVHYDIRIIGEEYRDKDFTGKQLALDNCREIYYNSRHHRFSSSQLRHIMENENGKDGKD